MASVNGIASVQVTLGVNTLHIRNSRSRMSEQSSISVYFIFCFNAVIISMLICEIYYILNKRARGSVVG